MTERKYLKSTKYDLTGVKLDKELRWGFYDAYHSNPATKLAIAAGENSIEGYKLDKYLNQTAKKISFKKPNPVPPPFDTLLSLQQADGRWVDLNLVLQCLEIPWRDSRIPNITEWEEASAFALAAMRQQIEIFDLLGDSHDKGMAAVFGVKDAIYRAQELITKQIKECHSGVMPEPITVNPPTLPQIPPAPTSTVPAAAGPFASTSPASPPASPSPLMSRQASVSPPRSPSPSQSDKFPVRSPSFTCKSTPQRSEIKIKAAEGSVRSHQMEVIRLSLELDALVLQIHDCHRECAHLYCKSETLSERNDAFEKLTAMLGDGAGPKNGFTDWRKDGVTGYRPLVVQFLCEVQLMADARLHLEESILFGGRGLTSKLDFIADGNRGRWGLIYGGDDVVHKVLHSLDFLRNHAELSAWYGRSFYFMANPLMLPFPMSTAVPTLQMQARITEQLESQAHSRIGLGYDGDADAHGGVFVQHFKYQNYLDGWQSRFESSSTATRSFNWPAEADIKYTNQRDKLYTAMLVLFIKCIDDITKTNATEKKLINLLDTARGKSVLAQSSNARAVPVVKKLDDVITSEMARAALLAQRQDRRNNNGTSTFVPLKEMTCKDQIGDFVMGEMSKFEGRRVNKPRGVEPPQSNSGRISIAKPASAAAATVDINTSGDLNRRTTKVKIGMPAHRMTVTKVSLRPIGKEAMAAQAQTKGKAVDSEFVPGAKIASANASNVGRIDRRVTAMRIMAKSTGDTTTTANDTPKPTAPGDGQRRSSSAKRLTTVKSGRKSTVNMSQLNEEIMQSRKVSRVAHVTATLPSNAPSEGGEPTAEPVKLTRRVTELKV